jgi:trans-2,3-dihydro-3-hydroxyanthranilate isomerase
MDMKFYFLDVFGTDKYSGNQLATFFDFGTLSTEEMQKIAKEINFSETTFITNESLVANGYPVRIFTPGSEIPFAGHPTLGTAYIIKKYIDKTEGKQIILNYSAGQIPVTIDSDELWMTHQQPEFGEGLSKSMLSKVLGLKETELDEKFPVLEVSTGLPFTIVPVKTLKSLKKACVNLTEYEEFINKTRAKGILIFCKEGREADHDLSSRVFVNYLGIPEDPATGSGTGCLAAYLLKTGYYDSKTIELTVGQGYEIGRPSRLRIKAGINGIMYEIKIGGKVIEISEGEWRIDL